MQGDGYVVRRDGVDVRGGGGEETSIPNLRRFLGRTHCQSCRAHTYSDAVDAVPFGYSDGRNSWRSTPGMPGCNFSATTVLRRVEIGAQR